MNRRARSPVAIFGDRRCTDLVDVTSDLAALDSSGFWAVVIPYSGAPLCARFAQVTTTPRPPLPSAARGRWRGPAVDGWTSGLGLDAFTGAVDVIRDRIGAGDVYQVNLTRRLSAPLVEDDPDVEIESLGLVLSAANPAPYSAVVRLPRHGIEVASASPELFVARRGRTVWSSPIKGTAPTPDGLTPKDRAENVMIVDLVRNDLGRVCEWGSVTVPALLEVEHHPGLVHLVSTVEGQLRADVGWAELLDATFPPGSVTGAPKIAACAMIDELEPVERGVYCGAVGWVDADRRRGELNVAIRTFWIEDDALQFGTGGAITWDSTASDEWAETELKAAHLLRVASGAPIAPDPADPADAESRSRR